MPDISDIELPTMPLDKDFFEQTKAKLSLLSDPGYIPNVLHFVDTQEWNLDRPATQLYEYFNLIWASEKKGKN